ncbi:hypothetical protein U1Q18_003368 [Sarracenia purpurea var. burkii]
MGCFSFIALWRVFFCPKSKWNPVVFGGPMPYSLRIWDPSGFGIEGGRSTNFGSGRVDLQFCPYFWAGCRLLFLGSGVFRWEVVHDGIQLYFMGGLDGY